MAALTVDPLPQPQPPRAAIRPPLPTCAMADRLSFNDRCRDDLAPA